MKKIALMVATAAAIFVAVPASAQTVVIRSGDGIHHRHHGAHHHNRGWNSRAEWRHRRHYNKHHHRHGVRRGSPAIVITR